MKTTVLPCLLLCAAACGGTTGNGSVAGTGTGTLLVVAKVEAENRADNAGEANGFDTRIEVVVKRGGSNVPDARVVVRSTSGERVLTYAGDRYQGGHVGYDRFYDLEVTAGADAVRGATIAGPALHRITNPLPGATVPPRQDLRVRWTRVDVADTASIETKRFKLSAAQDTGEVIVPGADLPGKVGETEEDEVKIVRRTRVGLAGGVAGSAIEASVRNRVQRFLVAPL